MIELLLYFALGLVIAALVVIVFYVERHPYPSHRQMLANDRKPGPRPEFRDFYDGEPRESWRGDEVDYVRPLQEP